MKYNRVIQTCAQKSQWAPAQSDKK